MFVASSKTKRFRYFKEGKYVRLDYKCLKIQFNLQNPYFLSGIADLTRLLANLGVSIKDMLHERAWIKSDIFSVAVSHLITLV